MGQSFAAGYLLFLLKGALWTVGLSTIALLCGGVLALIVALQGRFDEAERIVQADLPPAEAAAAVDELKQMIDQRGGVQRNAQRNGTRKTPKPRG